MKKNNNRKGFTIVELVIVIAVIAILAAVLIPTFSGMVNKANDSATLQEARNTYTNYIAENASAMTEDSKVAIKVGDKYFKFDGGDIDEKYVNEKPEGYTIVCDVCVDVTTDSDTVCDDCGKCVTHTFADGATSGTCTVCNAVVPAAP